MPRYKDVQKPFPTKEAQESSAVTPALEDTYLALMIHIAETELRLRRLSRIVEELVLNTPVQLSADDKDVWDMISESPGGDTV